MTEPRHIPLPGENQPYPFDLFVNYDPAQPLITIILRTFSGDHDYLPRALASVQAQTVPHALLELFIVNDGPLTEAESDRIAEWSKVIDFPAVLLGVPKTGYYCFPSNQAVVQGRGLYIAHLDADNEWTPDHLAILLEAMRTPGPTDGWPQFAYSRIHYVRDEGAPEHESCPDDYDSPLIPWAQPWLSGLIKSPLGNFVDSSAFMVSRGAMYRLADETGKLWNQEYQRFGDWELMTRFIACKFRGRAVDKPTLIYHWTGNNLQLQRAADEGGYIALPRWQYEELRERGLVRDGEPPDAEEPQ